MGFLKRNKFSGSRVPKRIGSDAHLVGMKATFYTTDLDVKVSRDVKLYSKREIYENLKNEGFSEFDIDESFFRLTFLGRLMYNDYLGFTILIGLLLIIFGYFGYSILTHS